MPTRENNFDIIRLLAALQVVIGHTKAHLQIGNIWLDYFYDNFLQCFPGVPIFFFISGFLIYWSYERNHSSLKKYVWNRIIRIYPALWVCFSITLIIILFFHPYPIFEVLSDTHLYAWILTQITFLQFYTPDTLRYFGVGTPNGSLWTISVEIQFYLILPLIYFLLNILKNNKLYIFILFLFLVSINVFIGMFSKDILMVKLARMTIFPYLYYFFIGNILFIYWDKLKKYLIGKFWIWFFLYCSIIIISQTIFPFYTYSYWLRSPLNLVAHITLAGLVMSFAFAKNNFSHILKGNDFSYGIYIYHMLVVNIFFQLNYTKSLSLLLTVILITLLLSWFSWNNIEKPMLKFKKKPFFKSQNQAQL